MINLKLEESFTSKDMDDRVYHCEKYYLSIPTAAEMEGVKEFLGSNYPGKTVRHYWTNWKFDIYLYRTYYDGEEPGKTVEDTIEDFKKQYYVV